MINKNYENLKDSYLFSTINKKVAAFQEKNPDKRIIRLGIGDVTRPLTPLVIEALQKAVEEQANAETFRGYGPEAGYDFLREALSAYYKTFNVNVDKDAFFVCDGAKSDVANILDIFGDQIKVAIPDPVYPVYLDTNIMVGNQITYMEGTKENGFCPMPSDVDPEAQIIYLCSPNNPTGAAYTKEQLTEWVNYANDKQAIILYDAAYESFVEDPEIPRSIFAIDGAETCAIEFGSFSKNAGFTGMRLSYTVISPALKRDGKSIADMWFRRQSTKFNGAPYIVQRAGAAALSPEGIKELNENQLVYKQNAQLMVDTLSELGVFHTGGKYSPYVWMACPEGMTSWDFFDELLEKTQIVGTPGSGFGDCGEGYFRLSSFASAEDVKEAMKRLKDLIG